MYCSCSFSAINFNNSLWRTLVTFGLKGFPLFVFVFVFFGLWPKFLPTPETYFLFLLEFDHIWCTVLQIHSRSKIIQLFKTVCGVLITYLSILLINRHSRWHHFNARQTHNGLQTSDWKTLGLIDLWRTHCTPEIHIWLKKKLHHKVLKRLLLNLHCAAHTFMLI